MYTLKVDNRIQVGGYAMLKITGSLQCKTLSSHSQMYSIADDLTFKYTGNWLHRKEYCRLVVVLFKVTVLNYTIILSVVNFDEHIAIAIQTL